ncbi:MAG: dihydrofolate reductase family protein [Planctomycetes bacterium]|nr:dihydrofolate reductase family protein [Planctomycetota bacterium]
MARPRVVLVAASSLDGKLSTVGRDPVTWTSRADRARLFERRDAADALLVGAGTIRAEDPPLLPTPARRAARAAAGKAENPLRVVVSRSLDLPVGRALAPAPDAPVVVVGPTPGSGVPEARARALEAQGLEVWPLLGPPGDLARALEALFARGVREVACEGGGALNAAMLAQGLVDEVHLTVCPVVLGGAAAPTLADGPGLPAPPRARLVECRQVGDEVFLTYALGSGCENQRA